MKKRKISTLILAIVLSLSMVIPTFAQELVVDDKMQQESTIQDTPKETDDSITKEESKVQEEESSVQDDQAIQDDSEIENGSVIENDSQVEGEAKGDAINADSPAIELQGEESESVVWDVNDFTYTTMEHSLYGCDYSRQFTVKGQAIAGFSASGLEKLKKSTDLVLPSVDDQGTTLIGVADNAFNGMGLTSVEFPSGMSIDYNDTVTKGKVTRRGNFMIGSASFANNNLTSVTIPDGVIAILPNAFQKNQITTVTLPRTIWWIETLSFAENQISKINFPKTTDFQLEIHGMAFASNNIKSAKIPDYCMVIFKHAFINNPGMEACPDEAPAKEKEFGGVVYLYTDNAALTQVDRIHHIEKTVESQKSWHQRIVYSDDIQIEDTDWSVNDFTFEGTTITGLSKSGISKRAVNKNLVLPDWTADYKAITEIAASTNITGGLFGTEEEGFDSVELPNHIEKIGDNVFRECGLTSVSFPSTLKEIGKTAFQTNKLTSIILPDSVTSIGVGAFATNPTITKITLSKNMKEIPGGAFGCSDAENWMEGLTSITIPEGVETIGVNAFSGNNFSNITIPKSVKEIGNYAFSTKNYLKTPCTLTLSEGLEKIGTYAFRNKIIEKVDLPTTVKGLPKNVFTKEASDSSTGLVTKVYVDTHEQYDDKVNFPASEFHKLYLTLTSQWTAEDFEYEEMTTEAFQGNNNEEKMTITSWAVKGFSEDGEKKLESNKDLVIPAVDPNGKKVTGIAKAAFKGKGIESLSLPTDVMADYKGAWNDTVTSRGDFVIGYEAFRKNNLTSVTIPNGTIWIDTYAFADNKLETVSFPKTIMNIGQGSFYKNEIKTVGFPESCDFQLTILAQAFMSNKIEAVQLPLNTEVVDKFAFVQNTGNEAITNGTAAEKKGGLVYMYTKDEDAANRANIAHIENATTPSNVQKLIEESIPEKYTAWNIDNFTLSEDQTTITGLSDSGKEKIMTNKSVIIPSNSKDGTEITAIGEGVSMTQGILDYVNEEDTYKATSVILPTKLKTIGKAAFAGSAITSIVLPATLTEIGMQAFASSNLTAISIPNSVTTMGMAAFNGATDLKSVVLSSGVKTILQSSFVNCPIDELVVPEGVEVIGRMAFNGTGLKKVELPETLVEIDEQAFYNCQLKELEIPSSVTTIGKSAFRVANTALLEATLEKLILHEGLTSIGKQAFDYSNLKSVEIPTTLTALDKDAFSAGKNLVTLYTSNKAHLEATDTFVPVGTNHKVVYSNIAGTGWTYSDFTYSEDNKTVTGWSDLGNEKRQSNRNLVIPATAEDGTPITAIGDKAFKISDKDVEQLNYEVSSPNGMSSVTIPDTVTTLGKQAFEYNNFTSVTLPVGLKTIGECAFKGNKLKSIDIPDAVETLGDGCFTVNALTEIKLPSKIKTIASGAFSMNIRLDHIDIPNTVTEIGDMAFAGARLTSLTIPASVKKIGRKAFHLHHLSELTIPGTVKEIGESAFEGTFKALTLKKLTLGEGIEKIGRYAFKEALLEEVTLPNSIKEIGEQPFLNNTGKGGKQVVICNTANPAHLLFKDSETHKINYTGAGWTKEFFAYNGTTIIGLSNIGKLFANTNKSLVIPVNSGALAIGENAFKGYGFTSVTLPATIATIKAGAFAENKLTAVVLPASISTISKTAFSGNTATVQLTTNDRKLVQKYPESALVGAKIVGPSGKVDLFRDVKDGNWYYDAVAYENARGIMTGLDATYFGASQKMSRSHFAVVLHRIEGSKDVSFIKKFSDVDDGLWYTKPILWASNAGVTTGYEDGSYGVSDSITREQLVLMMYRYANYKGLNTSETTSLSKYPDAAKVSGFAKEAMNWAVAKGLVTGDQGKINPQGTASRADASTILMRYMIAYDL